ncbi:hypothetical protein PTI98_009293 [Pleurotus ostreatus]|nr:hypothetical protein PTI98_009293 [Pleurotus ostreatus]
MQHSLAAWSVSAPEITIALNAKGTQLRTKPSKSTIRLRNRLANKSPAEVDNFWKQKYARSKSKLNRSKVPQPTDVSSQTDVPTASDLTLSPSPTATATADLQSRAPTPTPKPTLEPGPSDGVDPSTKPLDGPSEDQATPVLEQDLQSHAPTPTLKPSLEPSPSDGVDPSTKPLDAPSEDQATPVLEHDSPPASQPGSPSTTPLPSLRNPSSTRSPSPTSSDTSLGGDRKALLQSLAAQADILLEAVENWRISEDVTNLLDSRLKAASNLLRQPTGVKKRLEFLSHLEHIGRVVDQSAFLERSPLQAVHSHGYLHSQEIFGAGCSIHWHVGRRQILVGLTGLLSGVRDWLSQPSPTLTAILNLIIDMTNNNYSHGFMNATQVKRLKSGSWLSDDMIDYALGNFRCEDAVVHGASKDILICSSGLMPRMARLARTTVDVDGLDDSDDDDENSGKLDQETVKSLCALETVFNRDVLRHIRKIILPVCTGDHWILVHCNLADLVIDILDSRSNKVPKRAQGKHYSIYIERFCLWLKMLIDKYVLPFEDPVENSTLWTLKTPFAVAKANCNVHEDFPYQKNDNDCGLYVIKFAEHLLNGETINHDDVPRLNYIFT